MSDRSDSAACCVRIGAVLRRAHPGILRTGAQRWNQIWFLRSSRAHSAGRVLYTRVLLSCRSARLGPTLPIARDRAIAQWIGRARNTARHPSCTIDPSRIRIDRVIPKEALVLDIVEAFGRDRDKPIGRASAASGRPARFGLLRPPSRFAALVELTESLHPNRSALTSVLLAACLDQGLGR